MAARNRLRLPTVVLVLALVAVSCGQMGGETAAQQPNTREGADFDSGGTVPTAAADDADAPPASEEAHDRGDDSLAGDGAALVAQVVDTSQIGRDIIFTAELTVAVHDVAAATERATRVIQGLGGFVFGQRSTGGSQPSSVITFKVLPEDFYEALRRLGSLGELRNQVVSADDVTERIVDLESRIATAQTSVERLRALLAEAGSVEVIAQLENQLLERETQLETLRGQLRTLQDQVALATIVVTFTEAAARPDLRLVTTAYLGHDGSGFSCPAEGHIQVEEAAPVTLCFEITNTGDTPLTDLTLRDVVLDVEMGDLLVVAGDPEAVLEPGQSLLLALEIAPERDLRTQTTVTATPIDPEGNPLPARNPSATTSLLVDTVDPGGVPTFREGLEASWELLVTLGRVLLLAAGWLLPFLWLPVVLWLLWRGIRRRPTREAASPEGHAAGESEQDLVAAGERD